MNPSASEIEELNQVLDRARSVGDLGPEPNESVVSQSMRFARVIPDGAKTVADLGSGAGVPGLVISLARPDLHIRLIERSRKRCDGLELAVRRLGLEKRITIFCGDARVVSESAEWDGPVDVVVARSFSPIEELFAGALPLLAPGGLIAVSEPPDSDGSRWANLMPPGVSGPQVEDGIATFLAP